jgi:2-methylisocitrate lyase-like PEP mutase family enzyme
MGSDVGLMVNDLAELGVRRISVGSALSRVAWAAFLSAARGVADDGSFAGFTKAAPFEELNGMFG